MIASAVDRFLRPVAPVKRLAAVRVLVGLFSVVYLVSRSIGISRAASQSAAMFQPVGPVKLLAAPLSHGVVMVIYALTILLGLLFLLGWKFRLSGPAFALGLLFTLSYRNSFGMVFHTENLLVLHVLLLSLTDAAAAYSLDARGVPEPEPSPRFGFGLRVLSIGTVFAYFLAGVAKIKVVGWSWALGDTLRNHVAHDNLRKLLLGDSYSPIGIWLAEHAWLFPPLAIFALVLELGAPLALFSERLGRWWSALMWSFHLGVLLVMWILFPYPLVGIAFASFGRLELRWESIKSRWDNRQTAAP